jgi:phenylalanyl-tRNA synthetase beta chain
MRRPPAPPGDAHERRQLLRRVLTAGGCSEAITYGFIEEEAARAFVGDDGNLVRLANPLSETFAVLRPSLMPGLVDALVYNRRRGRRDIRLFELGRRFGKATGETPGIAIVTTGPVASEHWGDGQRWRTGERGGGRVPAADFYDLAGLVERLLDAVGVVPAFVAADAAGPAWLAVAQAALVQALVPGEAAPVTLGHVGQLDPAIAAARGLPTASSAVYGAELDLDRVTRAGRDRRRIVAAPPPRFPAIVRDIAIAVDRSLPAAAVRDTIRAVATDSLIDVRAFDRYEGAGVAGGRVSLAFRLTFRRGDRTLTDAEVQRTMQEIGTALKSAHQATFR